MRCRSGKARWKTKTENSDRSASGAQGAHRHSHGREPDGLHLPPRIKPAVDHGAQNRRGGVGVKLITRKGVDLAQRFPLAAAAISALPARSCIVDAEAIACDANGLSVFELLRYRRQDDAVTLCAFDLLELDGVDLRREPIEVRKRTLKGLLRREDRGITFNRHFGVEGAIVYRRACALGCEGIVSKRLGSPYRPGRQDCWIKVKNPAAPAVRRQAEEDWA